MSSLSGREEKNGPQRVECEPHDYNGLRVDHPDIVAAIRAMIRAGRKNEDIIRIVGMPQAVVNRLRHEKVRK